jgi:hypothetical protein
VLQRLGVYSVIRGAVDRPSFAMTRQILAEGKRRLVVFPEGETVWQNSVVMPFQQGVFQLAFKAYEDAASANADASLFCVPIAIRYLYLNDMHSQIDASLTRLEAKLALAAAAPPATRYDRLRRVADAVLAANERARRVKPADGSSLNDRVVALKERILTRPEGELGVTPSTGTPALDRVRALFNAVDRVIDETPASSDYEQRIAHERQEAARSFYHDLWRALRFVAIYDGYVSEAMNVDRCLDVLCLLENEVLQRRPIWGPRRACVEVGEPVNLKDYFPAYQADKRGTAGRVTAMIESSVREMLARMEADCRPLRLAD